MFIQGPDPSMSKVSKIKLDEIKRRIPRQPVLLKAELDTGNFEFECVAYDLSLKGVKLKLDLPLMTECEVRIMVRKSPQIPAKVVWTGDGFIGLEFKLSAQHVAELLGSIGEGLSRR